MIKLKVNCNCGSDIFKSYDLEFNSKQELLNYICKEFKIEIIRRNEVEKAYFDYLKENVEYARANGLCGIDFLSMGQMNFKDFLFFNYGITYLLENEILDFLNGKKVIFYNLKKNGEPQAVFVNLNDTVDVENAFYNLFSCDFKIYID